jgi:PRC-barrel domain
MAGSGRRPIPSLLLITCLVTCSSQIGPLYAQQPTPSQPPETQTSPPPQLQPLPPPAKQPEAAPRPAGEGIPALVVDGDQVMGVLGRQVRSSAGEDMGRIVDVIIDKSARVRAAVIDFGGFLGVGNRQIAVAWNAIRLPSQDKPGPLVVDFTRDQLRVAPTYKAGEQVVLLGKGDAPATTNGTTASEKDAPKEQPTK